MADALQGVDGSTTDLVVAAGVQSVGPELLVGLLVVSIHQAATRISWATATMAFLSPRRRMTWR